MSALMQTPSHMHIKKSQNKKYPLRPLIHSFSQSQSSCDHGSSVDPRVGAKKIRTPLLSSLRVSFCVNPLSLPPSLLFALCPPETCKLDSLFFLPKIFSFISHYVVELVSSISLAISLFLPFAFPLCLVLSQCMTVAIWIH